MPGSATSLDSLSSPSPSPSPPPESSKLPAVPGAGLGSGSDSSELSDLTEEEQETKQKKRSAQRRKKRGHNGEANGHTYARQRQSASRRGAAPRRKRSNMVPAPMWEWAEAKGANAAEEEEEEEIAGPPRAMEEEEDEDEMVRVSGHHRSGTLHKVLKVAGNDEPPDEGEADQEQEHDVEADPPDESEFESGGEMQPMVPTKSTHGRAQDMIDSNGETGLSLDKAQDEDEDEEALSDPQDLPDAVESEDGTEGYEDEPKPLEADAPEGNLSKANESIGVEDDETASRQVVAPLVATPAASSIMAGSVVIDAPSPSGSSSSGSSSTPSRSPSPVRAEEDGTCGKRDLKRKPSHTDQDSDITAKVISLQPPFDLPDVGIDAAEVEPDPDREADDMEADEPSPDLEMELELDLQPAHRAEALDVLAIIELKFALLRERLYVEKMESLAWEESLVTEGTHPEMLYLLAELSKRRDKRIQLATRKREFEIANVVKRRRLDEQATWSWWKHAQDELQTAMISETNRKRRRLERERKLAERPQPIRRMPQSIQDAPIPPSLRKIVNAFPYGHSNRKKRNDHDPVVYPEVTSLSPTEINTDLELLYQHRRTNYDVYRTGHVGAHFLLHGYEQYGDNVGVPPAFGTSGRLQNPVQQQQPQYPPLAGPAVGLARNYPPHPSSTMMNHTNHGQLAYPVDQERPGPSPIGSVPGGSGGYAVHGGQRSISPVHVMPNANHPKQSGGSWPGIGMGQIGISRPKGGEWDGRRAELSAKEEEERERANRKERERRDRDMEREIHEVERQKDAYHKSHHQQQSPSQHRHTVAPPHHQSTHQHPHQHPTQASQHHSNSHHHHHHHHHILHHHHNQQPNITTHGSASLPPPTGPSLSPRAVPTRELEGNLPHSGPVHPTEIINLSSKPPSHWKGEEPPLPSADYRDRIRLDRHGRPGSGPPIIEERDRPLATPFVLTSSHNVPQSHLPPNPPLPLSINGRSPPRNSWNPTEDSGFRVPPPSSNTTVYLGSHDSHTLSPGPNQHTNTSSVHLGRGPLPPLPQPLTRQGPILSPPRTRSIPQSPSSSSTFTPNPAHSPSRFGPQPVLGHSPNLKLPHPSSPSSSLASKMLGAGTSGGPPHHSIAFSPRLSGPGRTTTPTGLGPPAEIKSSIGSSASGSGGYGNSRTSSPLNLPYPSPSTHPSLVLPLSGRSSLGSMNGVGSDRDRERDRPDRERERDRDRMDRERHPPSPRLSLLPPPQKMNAVQMVDGH